MTVPKYTPSLDLENPMSPFRHHCQCLAAPQAETPRPKPPGSYDDFFPHHSIIVGPGPAMPGGQAYGAPPAAADMESSAGARLTAAALAALGESRGSRLARWIEAVQYNNRIAVGGSSTSAGGSGASPAVGAGELIAVGEWCPVDLWEYPVVLQSEDILAEEDAMSEWVEITHDEV